MERLIIDMNRREKNKPRSQKEMCVLSLTVCLLIITYPIAVLELTKHIGIDKKIDTIGDLLKYIGCSTIYIFLSYTVFYYIAERITRFLGLIYSNFKRFLKRF